MNSRETNDYIAVMFEEIQHKLAAVLEGQAAMASVPGRLDAIEHRLSTLESDVKAIKLVLKDFGKMLADHARRIARLESI